MRTFIVLFLSVLIIILESCNGNNEQDIDRNQQFIISDLKIPTNFSESVLYLDYDGAIAGFTIPSNNQTLNGKFDFSFKLQNTDSIERKLFYKVFYRNESYKFNAFDPHNKNKQHKYAHENFYGSWEDTNIGFKEIGLIDAGESIIIKDNFRIVGNPRNEEQYFYNGENDRWKRNPRVGDYSLLIVIVDDHSLSLIPDEIKYLHKKSGENFITPYFYFLHGEGKDLGIVSTAIKENFIKVIAAPDLGKGVFINAFEFNGINRDDISEYFNENCGNCEEMYNNATVAQFIHYVDKSAKLYNIPVIKDIFNEPFTKYDYNWGRAFYTKSERIGMLPATADYPCLSTISDSLDKKIIIKNPKTKYGEWRKQNAGMITRHGFTYGKYTVKANLTRLLNDDNVWNGITNAIWLIYQGGRGTHETGWNLRRPCTKKGYMKTYWGGREDDRVERVAYSEIDFEILKTVNYCPSNKYPPVYENWRPDMTRIRAWNTSFPPDVLKYDEKIAVCCTNWDMACWQPENFSSGCHEVKHEGQTFLAHRWEDVYRAVTTKYMAPDKELFGGDYYYFQIDWQPDKIIWRIGPEKDQLYIVGYVDNTISMIPDNQMLLIVTQEFHNTNWWPGSQYMQENIPFPAEDYVGEIYEIIVE